MDFQGNSLDRSLLLAEALQHVGQTVRLRRGNLSMKQVREHLLPQFKETVPSGDKQADEVAFQKVIDKMDNQIQQRLKV